MISHKIEQSENRKMLNAWKDFNGWNEQRRNIYIWSTQDWGHNDKVHYINRTRNQHNIKFQKKLTSRNSLPARSIPCWKASFSLSADWSGSVQSKFSFPTLEDKFVLFTYLGGLSVSYWLIPLSIASIAWQKSEENKIINRMFLKWVRQIKKLHQWKKSSKDKEKDIAQYISLLPETLKQATNAQETNKTTQKTTPIRENSQN